MKLDAAPTLVKTMKFMLLDDVISCWKRYVQKV